MAYNRFKLKDLEEKFGIQNFNNAFITHQLPTVEVSDFLLKTLSLASKEALGTEKAKSELVISPVIKYFKDCNADSLSYFSGYEFNVDTKQGLNGFCDYIISTEPHKYTIEAPIICLVEAKKGEIEEGFGQCGAEMYAAQLFNEQAGHRKKAIYGCVTNAFSWAFLKLEKESLSIDPNYVPLTFNEPHRVLAVLQWILNCSL
ncbi:MAG: hypothetical protein EAZ70_02635 [Runella slithyformis]|jgi:hypothetical protein|nr:MAG: hypothetical protein EAY79_02285 [Runella slithyformis]TAF95200.1 MAG: hypothetical protein EAZ46_08355 [Runella sp.]TAG17655.1 MAG: hypothetical protein EAZ38_16985 [Cytophagales bacterium]TAG40040.1 MAG: hypothetical protein EAZ32_07970 [Cytophagia bacterium]TAF29349.1 MAG: hypothetical protein EAZ70_02635 [Runella slithyformis]